MLAAARMKNRAIIWTQLVLIFFAFCTWLFRRPIIMTVKTPPNLMYMSSNISAECISSSRAVIITMAIRRAKRNTRYAPPSSFLLPSEYHLQMMRAEPTEIKHPFEFRAHKGPSGFPSNPHCGGWWSMADKGVSGNLLQSTSRGKHESFSIERLSVAEWLQPDILAA